LPFEEDWYRQRGVAAHFVGHPYFDEMHRQQLDAEFLRTQQDLPGNVVGLLPGSRTQEVQRNFVSMVRAAELIHAHRPDTRFLVACYKEHHRQLIRPLLSSSSVPIEAHVGRTPEIISAAHCCLAVSGSVSLELLFHRKPTAIIYRLAPVELKLGNFFRTARYITLVNLLADRELFPEFLVDHCPSQAMAERVLGWLDDPVGYAACIDELTELRERVAQPGACQRTAAYILNILSGHNDLPVSGEQRLVA
jgi:lipid-A-disaccharide synthase